MVDTYLIALMISLRISQRAITSDYSLTETTSQVMVLQQRLSSNLHCLGFTFKTKCK